MWIKELLQKLKERKDFPDGAEVFQRLSFLKEYGFNGELSYDGKQCCVIYSKAGLLIKYFEFYQFNEFWVIVHQSSSKSDQFDSVREYEYGFFYRNVLPLMKTTFNKKRFSNLDLVEFYIHNQIENGDSVFGVNKDEFVNC